MQSSLPCCHLSGSITQNRILLWIQYQFWDSVQWSEIVTLNWEFSLNSSSVELSIRPIHMKNSKMGLFSKKRELICIIEDWHYWEPIRSPFRHDHVIIDCQSKATLVYNRQFRDWRIFIAFADGSEKIPQKMTKKWLAVAWAAISGPFCLTNGKILLRLLFFVILLKTTLVCRINV